MSKRKKYRSQLVFTNNRAGRRHPDKAKAALSAARYNSLFNMAAMNTRHRSIMKAMQ